jgi:8-oxo-dGTP diphosphatase
VIKLLRLNFAVATDIVVFSIENNALNVLLVQRANAPHAGAWALPGGFVLPEENLQACAQRELAEETGVAGLYLEQLGTFGDVGRDARGRVVSVAYLALLRAGMQTIRAGSDASHSQWFAVSALPPLAFDHAEILRLARARLSSKVTYTNIALQLMPDAFTMSELQAVYEILREREMDKRNFRKQILAQGIVIETGGSKMEGAHRPAQLFRGVGKDVLFYN